MLRLKEKHLRIPPIKAMGFQDAFLLLTFGTDYKNDLRIICGLHSWPNFAQEKQCEISGASSRAAPSQPSL